MSLKWNDGDGVFKVVIVGVVVEMEFLWWSGVVGDVDGIFIVFFCVCG